MTVAPGTPPTIVSRWARPAGPATVRVQLGCLAAGVVTAAALPDGSGVGWTVAVLVVAVAAVLVAHHAPHGLRPGWAGAGVALLVVPSVRSADWLTALCVLTAVVTMSFSVTEGHTVRALIGRATVLPIAALRAVAWVASPATLRPATGASLRLAASVALTAVLVLVFGSLLIGADTAFGDLVTGLLPTLPELSPGRVLVLGPMGAVGFAGVCLLLHARVELGARGPVVTRRVRLIEWSLPVGMLVVLFVVFTTAQLVGVVANRGLVTPAEAARGGFWNLCAVTLLVLPVLGAALRWAPRDTGRERLVLKVLLAGVSLLTLGMVVSSLIRMGHYEQAYGATVLRLLVACAELWVGAVYLALLVSVLRGPEPRTGWIPRAAVAAGVATLLGLAALNPEGLVAQHNVDRFTQAGRIDLEHLSGLSTDAVPAVASLPEPLRRCALDRMAYRLRDDNPDPRSVTLADLRARGVLADAEPDRSGSTECDQWFPSYRW